MDEFWKDRKQPKSQHSSQRKSWWNHYSLWKTWTSQYPSWQWTLGWRTSTLNFLLHNSSRQIYNAEFSKMQLMDEFWKDRKQPKSQHSSQRKSWWNHYSLWKTWTSQYPSWQWALGWRTSTLNGFLSSPPKLPQPIIIIIVWFTLFTFHPVFIHFHHSKGATTGVSSNPIQQAWWNNISAIMTPQIPILADTAPINMAGKSNNFSDINSHVKPSALCWLFSTITTMNGRC